MNVLIVAPFFDLEAKTNRPAMIRDVLSSSGCNVFTLTSDFSHAMKKQVVYSELDIRAIKTMRYYSNTGISRFFSHILLSISFMIWYFNNRSKFDSVYVTSPFVIFALFVGIVNRSKLIIDVVDFWPDSLPFPKGRVFRLGTFIWHKINAFSYRYADCVISLSSTFLELVPERGLKRQISLGTHSDFAKLDFESNVINILYVGNIGQLYDFYTLVDSIAISQRKVKLHLVGGGDVLDDLIFQLNSKNVDYVYYGLVYDDQKLKNIASKCQLGFNGFKDETNASFSYKALTYLMYGLPILNSMQGDLYDIVIKNDLGLNYKPGDVESLLGIIDGIDQLEQKNQNVMKYFSKNLEYDVVAKDILNVFDI
ncbi:hypothetical protein [Vibrio sp. 1CM8B]|uniref:hypothetical protein n=1 Tax=Vibrio sp. 1CM8B TaxID=2929167 RepID=UPI0020BF347B|nr:hypothetical protein [Vibrio sp. 1CM8B]MCK8087070.1 hypothetical protein [Vibrio sp. 1CM8B]